LKRRTSLSQALACPRRRSALGLLTGCGSSNPPSFHSGFYEDARPRRSTSANGAIIFKPLDFKQKKKNPKKGGTPITQRNAKIRPDCGLRYTLDPAGQRAETRTTAYSWDSFTVLLRAVRISLVTCSKPATPLATPAAPHQALVPDPGGRPLGFCSCASSSVKCSSCGESDPD